MADDDLFDDDFEFDDEDDAELDEDYEYDDEEDDSDLEDDDEEDDDEEDDSDEDELTRGKRPAKKTPPPRGKQTDATSQPKTPSPTSESKGSGKASDRRSSRSSEPSGDAPRPAHSRRGGHGKPAAGFRQESDANLQNADSSAMRDEQASATDSPASAAVPAAPPLSEPVPAPPPGPPADHLVHIYEFGQLKRTLPRKFTDEEAVSFSEEYTRTSKVYGRLAVAMPDDEVPAPSFADAAKG